MSSFALEILTVTLTGLALGSFATALVYRVPRDLPWIRGKKGATRSSCPVCGETLKARDLLPLLSWLISRGRCRFCSAPVSVRYPLTELLTVMSCLGVYAVHGSSPAGVIIMAGVPFLVALLFIDLEHLILPNQLVAIVGVLALVFLLQEGVMLDFSGTFLKKAVGHGAGALLFAGSVWLMGFLMNRLLRRETLGFGDVKFFAVAGLWLGASALPDFLIFSGVCGVLMGLIWKVMLKKDVFPFGPALIVSLYAMMLGLSL